MNDTDKYFAIKAFLKDKLIEEEKGYESFYNEIMLMRCIRNKNVLRLIEIWESQNSYYLIMPVCYGGSLLERIAYTKKIEKNPHLQNEKDLGIVDKSFIKQFMRQMFEALICLKKQGILHRDLKPDNILLQSRYGVDPQIIDFGLATFQNAENYIYPKCGTPGYVAPEVINMKEKNGRYNSQCDVFSLGAIFYFLLTLKPLFIGKITKETIELNKMCFINFNCEELKKIDPATINLLEQMLTVDPQERITPEQALQHQYFVDNFLDDDYDIPDDPETSINQTLTRINDEKLFDMQRINNHSTKLHSSRTDQSLLSFNLIDGSSLLKKESSQLGASLIMKQPIAIRNIVGKQISLDNVIEEEQQVTRPKNKTQNNKYESPLKAKLIHKGTFEQADYEFMEEQYRIKALNYNKERSPIELEKGDKYNKQIFKQNQGSPYFINQNGLLKKVINRNDSIDYENPKPVLVQAQSNNIKAK